MKTRNVACVAAAVALVFGLAGCSEKPQTLGDKTAGTTVTRDTKPWQGEPLTFQAPYTRGDKASWENSLKLRQQSQNEYVRIGGQ
ncbi:MAG: hypothetical protein LC136_04390 [Burkholderiales bacterium]|nr:hypothetical protein [Burkholderiales bacterium]ODS99067.1 MAG: hypothetical protein ABS56_02965 [Lautropia sp. SCN 69-89]